MPDIKGDKGERGERGERGLRGYRGEPGPMWEVLLEMKEDIGAIKEDVSACSRTITQTRDYQKEQNGSIRAVETKLAYMAGVMGVLGVALLLLIAFHDHIHLAF